MTILKTDTVSGIGTEGTVFEGDITFDSLNYMTLPKGTTAQSNRGRGLYGGGSSDPSTNNTDIVYLNVQSAGNTIQFGDLTVTNRTWIHGVGSATRAIWPGGSNSAGPAKTNVIDYVTITTTGNATDFGDTLTTGSWTASHSNNTRGITAGGAPNNTNVMGYITIATTGNMTDFGDMTTGRRGAGRMGSTTRFIMTGGLTAPADAYTNIMDYVTIATTGNATDFGDSVAAARHDSGGCSSGTRGIVAGGQTPSATNAIQYVTIASTGNASDFGDLTVAQTISGALDNSIRGVFAGSYQPAQLNVVSYVEIVTTGNGKDFGDISPSKYAMGGTSDSHGGLSE